MSLCSQCGAEIYGDTALCVYHHAVVDSWATENRILCDLLHRGVIPQRLSEAERTADVVSAPEGFF